MKILYSIIFLLVISLNAKSQATAELYYEQSIEKLNKKDVEGALKDIQKSLDLKPDFVDSYYLRGFVHQQMGKLDLALLDYDKLIELDPKHLGGLLNRAALKLNTGDIDGAIHDHSARIELDPSNETYYFDRAFCKGLKGDFEGAIEDYTSSIKINPMYKEAYANSGFTRINNLTTKGKLDPTAQETEDACKDLLKAKELGDDTVDELISIYCSEKPKKEKE
jgi:tetratricopeptide (TPR) repeat protein